MVASRLITIEPECSSTNEWLWTAVASRLITINTLFLPMADQLSTAVASRLITIALVGQQDRQTAVDCGRFSFNYNFGMSTPAVRPAVDCGRFSFNYNGAGVHQEPAGAVDCGRFSFNYNYGYSQYPPRIGCGLRSLLV